MENPETPENPKIQACFPSQIFLSVCMFMLLYENWKIIFDKVLWLIYKRKINTVYN